MASTIPAERDLRRVIGDGDAVPDGEVEGVGEQELLELYRSMVLLRTYDERSVVYHSQGRIGTYAIFWGHEAIQAGAVPRARRRRLDLPELPRVGDRPAARHAAGDGALLVARPSRRLVEPGRLQPRLDLRPDRHARAARRRARVGEAAEGRGRLRARLLRRRRDLRGLLPRGRQLRRRDAGAARPPLQQQRLGDLDAALGADEGRGARRQGRRLRDSGPARRRRRRARRLRGDARGGRAGARRRGADLHRGRHLPLRPARDRRRSEGVHRPRASRRGAAERVPRPLRALPPPARAARRRPRRRDQGRGGRPDARRDRRRRGRAARRTSGSSSSTRSSTRRSRSRTTSPSCGGSSGDG